MFPGMMYMWWYCIYGHNNGQTYGKNDSFVTTTNGSFPSPVFVNSMFVSGNDVYLAGSGTVLMPDFRHVAMYWKNGATIILPDAGGDNASSIFVSGNDVYIAGNGGTSYWKNGNSVVLDSTIGSYASSIYVSGNDVYVAGTVYNGAHEIAEYLKTAIG